LSTIDRVCGHRIAKQFTLGTTTGLSPDTVITFLTGRVERHDNLIADLKVGDRVALLLDYADKFVSTDEVWRAFEVATVEVQIGALWRASESMCWRKGDVVNSADAGFASKPG
jgi:hypothetical protein